MEFRICYFQRLGFFVIHNIVICQVIAVNWRKPVLAECLQYGARDASAMIPNFDTLHIILQVYIRGDFFYIRFLKNVLFLLWQVCSYQEISTLFMEKSFIAVYHFCPLLWEMVWWLVMSKNLTVLWIFLVNSRYFLRNSRNTVIFYRKSSVVFATKIDVFLFVKKNVVNKNTIFRHIFLNIANFAL